MDVRVLRYFLAVAREESISGAAQYLHLSQPTLSRQLMELERELGKKLFNRGNRRITLTEDGILLRRRAEDIVDLIEKTQLEFQKAVEEEIVGDVYISGGETGGSRLLARTAYLLQQRCPNIHFHISSGDGVDVMERLEKGLADLGLLVGPIALSSQYERLLLPVRDAWGVLMPKGHPLAPKEAVTPQDLWDQPLILSRQAAKGSLLEKWLGRDLNQLQIVGTYNLIYNASLMVEEGMGLALGLDRLINTAGDSRLCFRPLSPRLESELTVVWKKYQILSKAAQAYLGLLVEQIQPDEI